MFIKIDPARSFENVSKKVGDIISGVEKNFRYEGSGFKPRVDITENESNIFVHAEFPGMSKQEISITVNSDKLLILKGDKKRVAGVEGKTLIRSERNFGSFERSFNLPEEVDLNNISASFENGVLEIVLIKISIDKQKEISIDIK